MERNELRTATFLRITFSNFSEIHFQWRVPQCEAAQYSFITNCSICNLSKETGWYLETALVKINTISLLLTHAYCENTNKVILQKMMYV